jgi:hypothetical protein
MNCIFFSVGDVTVRWIHVSAVKFGLLQQIVMCFKKIFTTLKAYIDLLRGHVQCFELS